MKLSLLKGFASFVSSMQTRIPIGPVHETIQTLCCKSSCVKVANANLKETNSKLPSVRYMKI